MTDMAWLADSGWLYATVQMRDESRTYWLDRKTGVWLDTGFARETAHSRWASIAGGDQEHLVLRGRPPAIVWVREAGLRR